MSGDKNKSQKSQMGEVLHDLMMDTEKTKDKTRRKISIGTEDIIALGCILIALVILLAVIFGKMDTAAGLTAVTALVSGGLIVKVVQAKKKKH